MIYSTIRKGLSTIAVSCAATAFAGDLNPPAGPIGATMKTLSEVEPRIAINATNTPGDADSVFKISNPGSYYLTGLLFIPPGKMGIEIANDDVTIDLSGYRMGGIAGTLDGIRATGPNRRNITIRNGGVINCQGHGINFDSDNVGNSATACRVVDVTIMNCSGSGLQLGDDSIAERVVCVSNGGHGIATSSNCSLIKCVGNRNDQLGIYLDFGGTAVQCTANENGWNGLDAVSGAVISQCNANGNFSDGIAVSSGSSVQGCVARGNERNGIAAGNGNLILENTCEDNGLNTGGHGINVGSRNRIEGNHCVRSAVGIAVGSHQNVIIRNTCTANVLNWSIVEHNYYGPIINQVGMPAPAMSGDSAAGTLGTTNPFANFTH